MQRNDATAVANEVAGRDINHGAHNSSALEAGLDSEIPPPAPQLYSEGIITTDITKQFKDAAQKLSLGELVKDPLFSLFDSVGALEIMDRKMDSGYLETGETMEDDYDYGKTLLPEEVLGIIDQLLLHEVAWHMGYPLSQTIFTSLYINRILSPTPLTIDETYFDRVDNLPVNEPICHQVLRAYSLGLLKTCCYVNNRIKAEHYYEEEDFVTQTYRRSLLEDISSNDIQHLLAATVELLSTEEAFFEATQHALILRLKFRMAFLLSTVAADGRIHEKSSWDAMLEYLPQLQATIPLGKPVLNAFSTKLQRNLASTLPPRPMVQIAPSVAYSHLERLCRDGALAVEIFEYRNPNSLMCFITSFQAQKPQPSVYIRALLQHYIFCDMVILANMSIRQLIDDDLAGLVLPGNWLLDRSNDEVELPTDPRYIVASRMESFRQRIAETYLDMLRTLCQNRCRVRRILAHSIVIWDTIQLDAEDLDQDLLQYTNEDPITDKSIAEIPILSYPLSSWAYFHKLRQMAWAVQVGFELQVYQPDELAGMYWYLHYLAKTRTRHLERIKSFIVHDYTRTQKMLRQNVRTKAERLNALSFNNLQMLESASTYALADSLSSLFTVLDRLSLVPKPSRPYSDDCMRYEIRMKPFLSVGLPEVVSFEEFTLQVRQPGITSIDLLNYAAKSAAAAKRTLEALSKLDAEVAFCEGSHAAWTQDTKNCLKACILTNIGIASVKRAIDKNGKDGKVDITVELPESGKGYHDWWVVPKILQRSEVLCDSV